MPCCSLIVLLLSQPLMLFGAMKTRLLKTSGVYRFSVARVASEQRWLGLASLFAVEIVLASALAPYVLASSLPAEAHAWGTSLWQICSVDR
jgi:hypothetical protein